MIDFVKYIEEAKRDFEIDDPDFRMNVSRYFVSNRWFGIPLTIDGGEVLMDEKFIERLEQKFNEFCEYYANNKSPLKYIMERFSGEMPITCNLFRKYIEEVGLDDEPASDVADFLVYNLFDELPGSTNTEIGDLMDAAYEELRKVTADILTDFINWTKSHTKTVYNVLCFMEQYSTRNEQSEAYDPHSYLSILYHLYNADYIADNDMYAMAAESKKYTDTWLFLALHFLCALRNTDLVRIPHPRLIDTPEETLRQIAEGTFSDENARIILNTVVWHLDAIMLTPNKTAGTSGVGSIKIHIPESVEVHVGTLFALAEAHFRLNETDLSKPLIHCISSYEQINRYMGEEIGDLFLDSDFRSRAANKSYMQMVFLLTDEILGVNDEFHVKGYILAALARSHKGSYGDFAKTTSIYLKDAKMNGFTPEFVARELFERGVLSMIPSMLLKMIIGDEYEKLSVESQTKLIKELNMSPLEVEEAVGLMQTNIRMSVEAVKGIYEGRSERDILEVLHRIGNNEAVSKCDGCLCLMTAMRKTCPYPDNHNCPSCKYEISTKTTMYLMVQECNRLKEMIKSTESDFEKNRCKHIIRDVIIPSITEMLTVVEEKYGPEGIEALDKIITEGA